MKRLYLSLLLATGLVLGCSRKERTTEPIPTAPSAKDVPRPPPPPSPPPLPPR